jgi:hypothetical protein
MKRVYKVLTDGTIEGLWNDSLSEMGEAEVTRASQVEFVEGGWTVEILIGKFAGCFLPKSYPKRADALKAEVEFFNVELAA